MQGGIRKEHLSYLHEQFYYPVEKWVRKYVYMCDPIENLLIFCICHNAHVAKGAIRAKKKTI